MPGRPLQIGETLGSWVLIQPAPASGVGLVFFAKHKDTGEPAIVRAAPAHMDATQAMTTLLAEGRALRSIAHENSVELKDLHEAPPYYFVTEVIRGRPLHDRMANAVKNRGRLELQNALHIGRQLGAALAAAHDADIVHRRLTPAHVFLVNKNGDPDFVKVLELGSIVEQRAADASARGHGPVQVGAPSYMAPEQLRLEAGDHRIDIYTFGIILFELCVGRRPFEGADVRDVVRNNLLSPPPQVSTLLPAGTAFPPALETVLRRCLEKRAQVRPGSMHDVVLALASIIDVMGPPRPDPETQLPGGDVLPPRYGGEPLATVVSASAPAPGGFAPTRPVPGARPLHNPSTSPGMAAHGHSSSLPPTAVHAKSAFSSLPPTQQQPSASYVALQTGVTDVRATVPGVPAPPPMAPPPMAPPPGAHASRASMPPVGLGAPQQRFVVGADTSSEPTQIRPSLPAPSGSSTSGAPGDVRSDPFASLPPTSPGGAATPRVPQSNPGERALRVVNLTPGPPPGEEPVTTRMRGPRVESADTQIDLDPFAGLTIPAVPPPPNPWTNSAAPPPPSRPPRTGTDPFIPELPRAAPSSDSSDSTDGIHIDGLDDALDALDQTHSAPAAPAPIAAPAPSPTNVPAPISAVFPRPAGIAEAHDAHIAALAQSGDLPAPKTEKQRAVVAPMQVPNQASGRAAPSDETGVWNPPVAPAASAPAPRSAPGATGPWTRPSPVEAGSGPAPQPTTNPGAATPATGAAQLQEPSKSNPGFAFAIPSQPDAQLIEAAGSGRKKLPIPLLAAAAVLAVVAVVAVMKLKGGGEAAGMGADAGAAIASATVDSGSAPVAIVDAGGASVAATRNADAGAASIVSADAGAIVASAAVDAGAAVATAMVDAGSAPEKVADKIVQVKFESDPKGAVVKVGAAGAEQQLGKAPLTVGLKESLGEQRVVFELAGREPVVTTVTIAEGAVARGAFVAPAVAAKPVTKPVEKPAEAPLEKPVEKPKPKKPKPTAPVSKEGDLINPF